MNGTANGTELFGSKSGGFPAHLRAMEDAGPLVSWAVKELKLLTADASVDAFLRCLNAVISWCAACLCLLRALPPALLEPFQLFLDTVDALQTSLVLALGRSFTSPHMTLQWRRSDTELVTTQNEHIINSIMNLLDGLHAQLADCWSWCNPSENEGLRFEASVEAVSASIAAFTSARNGWCSLPSFKWHFR